MAVNPQIFLIPDRPLFNIDAAPLFESFTQKDSALLFSNLYFNYRDIFSRVKSECEVTYFFDERDKEFLPHEFLPDEINKKFFINEEAAVYINRQFEKKIQTGFSNILLIFANSIGLSPEGISKIFNLLNYDDNCVILGKSHNNCLTFAGFNYYDDMIFDGLNSFLINYEDFLKRINSQNSFLFIKEGFHSVQNINDFKILYNILSKKESTEFCSHEMHELFTHLFIEYKEVLK